jgi:pimeloyl-ACP methyl ester carboxylesterase
VLDQNDDDLAVVGASLSGYVALAMARSSPERVRDLLLAGSRAGADTPERRAARQGIGRWEENRA